MTPQETRRFIAECLMRYDKESQGMLKRTYQISDGVRKKVITRTQNVAEALVWLHSQEI